MVGVAVGLQRRAVSDALVLRVDARHRAQPLQRRRRRPRVVIGDGLPDEHLRARVGRPDRVVAGDIERAVDLRRLPLRRDPGRVVRLVPDRVAVHPTLEVLRCRAHVVGVEGRVGVDDREADAVVARGVRGRRAGERQLRPDPVLGGCVDRVVDRIPVVVRVARRRRLVGVGHPRPLHEDAHAGDAERLSGGEDGLALAVFLVDEGVLVLDRHLHAARCVGGRRGKQHQHQRKEDCPARRHLIARADEGQLGPRAYFGLLSEPFVPRSSLPCAAPSP